MPFTMCGSHTKAHLRGPQAFSLILTPPHSTPLCVFMRETSLSRTALVKTHGVEGRAFDTKTSEELFCTSIHEDKDPRCRPAVIHEHWSSEVSSERSSVMKLFVSVTTPTGYGWSLSNSSSKESITFSYTLQAFISTIALCMLTFRWFVSLRIAIRSYRMGRSPRPSVGISCLSSSQVFTALPVLATPHMKSILAAFWSAGCRIGGPQRIFADAWFVMYSGMIEYVFVSFSVLNAMAKVLHYLMSDAFCSPTILLICFMHYNREWLSTTG